MSHSVVGFVTGTDNIFRDLGFSEPEAVEAIAKSELISAISAVVSRCRLTQRKAAALCGTRPAILSRVLRGRMENVTVDQLAAWLKTLQPTVKAAP